MNWGLLCVGLCVLGGVFEASADTITISWGFNTVGATRMINVHDTVVWQWDQGSTDHTLVSGASPSDDGKFGLRTPQASGEYSYTFDEAGLYRYHCGIHTFMQAKIFVRNGKNADSSACRNDFVCSLTLPFGFVRVCLARRIHVLRERSHF
jgi:hypothetical protein